MSTNGVRLNRYLAEAGLGSRRAVEALITGGRVEVAGTTEIRPARRVLPSEEVRVDGLAVSAEPRAYVLLHKPVGVVTTVRDTHGRRTVVDLVRRRERLYPVGRLDADTSGALLLTNDGTLAHRLMHPRFGVEKEYVAEVHGELADEAVHALAHGVLLDGRVTAPARVHVLDRNAAFSTLEIVLHEGRNRQVRRMLERVGHPVRTLHRVRYAGLDLDGLEPGAWRELSADEVEELRRAGGL